MAQRRAALAQADIDLTRTQIVSPVDGVVINRSIERQGLKAGQDDNFDLRNLTEVMQAQEAASQVMALLWRPWPTSAWWSAASAS